MRVSENVALKLLDAIRWMAERPEECARSPGRDFTRVRSLGLGRLLLLLVTWAQDTVAAELADLAGWDGTAPKGPALTQQWAKLRDDALPRLLRRFLSGFAPGAWEGRYRLYAADGTELQLLPGTGGGRCRVRNGNGGGCHWEAHLTCAYDLVRRTFEDMVAQGGAEEDEPAALCELVDRAEPGAGLRALWLADRNFCTWNVIHHLDAAGASFCLRAKDSWVSALLRGDEPAGEFDLAVERCVTRSRSARGRSRPSEPWLYRAVHPRSSWDGPEGERWLRLRVVRVALPPLDGDGAGGDRWLNLVTDLPASEASPAGLAELYALRWGEEVGFSHLRHTVGMRDPRTRDLGRAVQEAWGRLVLYDACSLGVSGVPGPKPGPRHGRATDRTAAFKAFMRMLRALVRRAAFDVEAFAARQSHSVRRCRGHPRRRRASSPPRSGYRH